MKGKEIERKYLVDPAFLQANRHRLPESPQEVTADSFECSYIEQYYLCTAPVLRIRLDNAWQFDAETGKAAEAPSYILTCKGKGSVMHDELNLPMPVESYLDLKSRCGGSAISKRRYRIPLAEELTAELDVFTGAWEGRIVVEVEFPDLITMDRFRKPDWFLEDVTEDPTYRNAWMSRHTASEQ
ncbi:MAG: adenylate cyclase [Lachnospiraceae bacterium]|nr:adenylate cyclase [Lachnospiraceae bacterium]